MRRRSPRPFHKSARHSYRMELIVEFGEPVAAPAAREAARRLLESMQLSAGEVAASSEVQACRLKCHETRQIVSLLGP